MINEFKGEYYFLSNYYPCEVAIHWSENTPLITFHSAEAAFQASKAQSYEEFASFAELDAPAAKRKGRKIKLRSDWEEIKDQIMMYVVCSKFEQNIILQNKLLSTSNEELIEGNTWNDTYWGVCKGIGKNKLGQILMNVRDNIWDYGLEFEYKKIYGKGEK